MPRLIELVITTALAPIRAELREHAGYIDAHRFAIDALSMMVEACE